MSRHVAPLPHPPSAPGDLTATEVDARSVTLTWTAARSGCCPVDHYEISFSLAFNDVVSSTRVGNVTTATITNLAPAPVPTTPPVTPPATTAPPAPGCSIAYHTHTVWPGGFVAELTVTNTIGAAVDGWRLTFTYTGDQKLTTAWNAKFTQAGATVTLTPETWNRRLAAGEDTFIGLVGTWRTSNLPPTTFALNGSPCTGSSRG